MDGLSQPRSLSDSLPPLGLGEKGSDKKSEAQTSSSASFGDTFSDSQQKDHSNFIQVSDNTFRQEDDSTKKSMSVIPALIGFKILNFSGALFQINPQNSTSEVVVLAIHHLDRHPGLQKVLFQVEGSVPMDITIEKSQQKLSITISLSSENKARVSPYLPELSELIAKRLDNREVSIDLQAPPQFNHGQGEHQSGQQNRRQSSSHESEDTFFLDVPA